MLRRIREHLQRQDGVAAVEFAIVSMVFLVLLYGILTYGFIYSMDQSFNHAAEEGARSAISQTTEAAAITTAQQTTYDRLHWLQPSVGHYGVFNGSRFRAETAPRIADFILSNNGGGAGSRAPAKSPRAEPKQPAPAGAE